MLPADDAELQQWLCAASDGLDSSAFQMLFAAACFAERKLPASLLTAILTMGASGWQMAWAAWRMHGNVTEELLRALESGIMDKEKHALILFVAAAWWREHRAGEDLPRTIWHEAKQLLAADNPEVRAVVILQNLAILLDEKEIPGLPVKGVRPLGLSAQRVQLQKMFALLNGPFEKFVYERETHEYTSSKPFRRAVEEVGRNQPCPCGSGKKHKHCCLGKNQQRLSRSSSIPGVTKDEIMANPGADLTAERLLAMHPTDVLRIDPLQVPKEVQAQFILTLMVIKHYDEAIAALRVLGVPEHLQSVWSHMFQYAGQAWRPDIARALMEIFPQGEEVFGVKANAGIRLMLVADDPAKLLETLEAELRAALESADLEDLQKLIWIVIESPYRALGIFLMRSLLQIVESKYVPGLFEGILKARAQLNLSPNDEFSDFIDERALRERDKDGSATEEEAQAKLEAKAEEIRQLKESMAGMQRQIHLLEKRMAEAAAAAPTAESAKDEALLRELKDKVREQKGLLNEWGKDRVTYRRELQSVQEALAAALKAGTPAPPEEEDEEEGEPLEVTGNQPVRMIEFPKKFAETLLACQPHVGRAAMKCIGHLASGEKTAFAGVVALRAYHGVLRKKVASSHRLLFTLEPDRLVIVDLISRQVLDRRIEQLKASGH